jgi:hypothetical protein
LKKNIDIEKVLQVSEQEIVKPEETFTSEKARAKEMKRRAKAAKRAAKLAKKNQAANTETPLEKPVYLSIPKGKYAYLSEAKLTDLKSGKVYKFSDLYNGIEVKPFSEGENRKLGLSLDISDIDTSKVCKNQLPKRKIWAIQVPLKGKI